MNLTDTAVYAHTLSYIQIFAHACTCTHTLQRGGDFYQCEPRDIQNQWDKTDMQGKQHKLKPEKPVLPPAFV